MNRLINKLGLRVKCLDLLVYLIRNLYYEVDKSLDLSIYGKGYVIGYGNDMIIRNMPIKIEGEIEEYK